MKIKKNIQKELINAELTLEKQPTENNKLYYDTLKNNLMDIYEDKVSVNE